jgi:hypothetical protein
MRNMPNRVAVWVPESDRPSRAECVEAVKRLLWRTCEWFAVVECELTSHAVSWCDEVSNPEANRHKLAVRSARHVGICTIISSWHGAPGNTIEEKICNLAGKIGKILHVECVVVEVHGGARAVQAGYRV